MPGVLTSSTQCTGTICYCSCSLLLHLTACCCYTTLLLRAPLPPLQRYTKIYPWYHTNERHYTHTSTSRKISSTVFVFRPKDLRSPNSPTGTRLEGFHKYCWRKSQGLGEKMMKNYFLVLLVASVFDLLIVLLSTSAQHSAIPTTVALPGPLITGCTDRASEPPACGGALGCL